MNPEAGRPPLYVHIGLPKTGTTYLQELLAANRELLKRSGIDYPLAYPEAMFHAAIDLRGTREKWGLEEREVGGAWDRLVAEVRRSEGPVLISHENLSAATPEQIERVIGSFPDHEVHVVVTLRDLGRQLTAGWQEGVKTGSGVSFGEFSDRVLEDLRSGSRTHRFWRMQDVPGVLAPWAAATAPERVHAVVCPRPGADRWELWSRFAAVIGLPPDLRPDDSAVRANESLGVAAIAVLRDVNVGLRDRIDRATYRHVVKRHLAQRVLTAGDSPRPALGPGPLADEVDRLAADWVDYLRGSGFAVYGDPADLVPGPPTGTTGPDDVSDADKYDAARLALVELLLEVGRLRKLQRTSRSRRVADVLLRARERVRGRRGKGSPRPG